MARRRRGRGEGGIIHRSDGSWEARVSLGYNEEGKRKTRSVYGTSKAEVQEKLRTLQTDAGSGQLMDPTTLTVGQYLKSWLEDTAKPKTSPTTYERYEQLVRLHITPHIGGTKLSKLAPIHISRLAGAIARSIEADGKGKSPAWTQKMAGTLLHNALRHAVRLRLIAQNPAAELPRAKPAEKEMRILSKEQIRDFLAASGSRRLHALFSLALGSGMRQGELLGLQWEDIDFTQGALTVRRSLAQLKGKFVLKEPKSKQSRRTIKLPAFAVGALRQHRERMVKEGNAGKPVFCTKNGTYIGKSNLTRQVFRPALKAAGMPEIRFHDLRHSHASALLRDGASIKAVSRRLGHSTVELTLRVYYHLLPDADEVLASQAEQLFTECGAH